VVLGVLVVEVSGACWSLLLSAGRCGRAPQVTGSGRSGGRRAAVPGAPRAEGRRRSPAAPGADQCPATSVATVA